MNDYSETNYMPTMDTFLEKLYSLHPIGNPEVMYEVMKEHLGTVLPNKDVLTFELLCQKYEDYCKYIKPYNDIKDKQYIKKDKMQKEIGAYLITKMYVNDYSSQIGDPNDNYLFGI